MDRSKAKETRQNRRETTQQRRINGASTVHQLRSKGAARAQQGRSKAEQDCMLRQLPQAKAAAASQGSYLAQLLRCCAGERAAWLKTQCDLWVTRTLGHLLNWPLALRPISVEPAET